MTREKTHEEEFEELREKLQSALPPVRDTELRRDLWPLMLRRLEEESSGRAGFSRVPWFDWALLGVAGATMVFFPALIPALLYHL